MKLSTQLVTLIVLSGTLLMAGCSYSPARITPEPLIEIDGHDGHYHHSRRYYYDDDDWDHDHYYYERRGRGGFCPPGQAKKGRC
ncbi:hypothetical protein [Litchfieldella rifensis]|uniref:Lipoprotein n=1 Tax=Litchfieldella rifensis TaxID=762643 RepID=A0ABV7LJT1_9GAMM